nr:retrovirus-related Pol polyprotein from transposon TNT 1-94 [Tanacetum cinerariifolium]
DSKAAIAISCNPVQHSRTKHIDVRYHYIKEKVEKGIIELFFVGKEYQLADLFTKALPVERFQYLVRRLGMRCLTPAELEALVVSIGGSFVSAVTYQMTYHVASLTLESARSYVMQGASFTQGMISSIPIGGSISPEGFVPSILLLMVIIVMVLIVVVILVVVVVAIVGVVIVVAIIGVVVVVVGVSLNLAFLLDTMENLKFKTSKNRYGDNRMSDSIGGLVFLVTKSSGGVIDLIDDEDPTYEDGDTGMDDSTRVSASLSGEISLGGKKSQESNSDNTGGTIVGEAIGTCSGGIDIVEEANLGYCFIVQQS